MRRRIVIPAVVLLVGGVIVLMLRSGEPRYQGRTLTSWLQQCADSTLMETQRLTEAQTAIRAIGAQKALPELLKLVKTRDSRIGTWLVEQSEKSEGRFFHWHSATELQLQGIAGFEALGTNGAPAIGELTQLLDDKELAFVATRCLDNTGKPAEAALCGCLTNQNSQVRRWSVPALAAVTDDVEVYIARIKDRLNDADASVRFATVQAIGGQENAPELAVPLLIAALNDADDSVCGQAAEALANFGTNGASAFSALTNLVNTGRIAQARAGMNVLAAIDPVRSISVLSNAVVSGSSATLGTALKSLKTIAPKLALEMTLGEFQSPDSRRRSQAVSVALNYDMATPGIAEALKSAAADTDPDVARRAVMTMRQMLQKQKEAVGSSVQIPGELSYLGKPLSQWLKLRQVGGELSTNAVEALRAMGTNAIPALLARLAYQDPVFQLYDSDVSMDAVVALISLRETAGPALPALTAMMDSDNSDLALRAMLATLGTGSNAVPCLMKGLTNRFADVRNEAASNLTGEWSAQYPEARKQAVPLLIELLNDPDEFVRRNVTNELREVDPGAAAKAGIK